MFSIYFLLVILFSNIFSEANENDEALASQFHDTIFEPQIRLWNEKLAVAGFEYETNVTEENSRILTEVNLGMADFIKESSINFTSYDWRNFRNETLKRLFRLNSKLQLDALDDQKLAQITEIVNNMTAFFGTVTVCDYKDKEKCDLNFNPEVLDIMATSRNYYELLHIWEEWHNKCGRPMRKMYKEYVSLRNEAANLNGFISAAEMWMDDFDSDTFEDEIEAIWQQLKPYYEDLHAYVRRKLISVHGEDKVREDGPIPAHILGDPWAQIWTDLYDIFVPFPNKPTLQITEALQKQGYTVVKMFELADSFYQSLGLLKLPETFWTLSMMTKPTDREVICHATAWHINETDVRIKMCGLIDMENFFTIHHELGHLQYYLQYSHLPSTFEEAANPGFHEAIGDTVLLSVTTPKHLKKIGLISDFQDDEAFEINFLMLKALHKFPAAAFSYLVDKWRWQVFRGEITPKNYNTKWWEMSKFYQGIEPHYPRSERDFDAGVKMHVASDDPMISYLVSALLQFQFHEALCIVAGEFDPQDPQKPLYKCDINGNKQAGAMFGNVLKQGSSRPWKDILQELTGKRKLDARSMINYFTPLFKYIRSENRRNNEYIGWRDPKRIHSISKNLIGLPIKKKKHSHGRSSFLV